MEVIEPLLAEHRGRLFKTTGEGFLAEFASAVQAVTCARTIQKRMAERKAAASEGGRFEMRIGLYTGDVLVEGDDLFGDGVNVAARLEALAEPGGICISARVREDPAGKITLDVKDIGTPELKNIAQPVPVFRVRLGIPERPALALVETPEVPGIKAFIEGADDERWLKVIGVMNRAADPAAAAVAAMLAEPVENTHVHSHGHQQGH